MISKNTIDQVYETARVEEVIGDFVGLKKSGTNFKGLSPFTQERSPSFMVSPVKQIWKDFSSGKGGNVVAFLMEHEHFSYPEAIRYLAKKYNVEMGAAALQFSMKDKRITSTLCGVTSIQSIEKNLAWANTNIPEEFWNEVLKLPYSTKDPESERNFTPG